MSIPDKYLVAFTAQKDIIGGVTTSHRLAWVSCPKDGSFDLYQAMATARELHGMSSEFRIISSLICPIQPFESPTECEVAITLMPGGAGFTARLRLKRRKFVISDGYTLCDAFGELADEENDDSIVGWSYTPVILHPAP